MTVTDRSVYYGDSNQTDLSVAPRRRRDHSNRSARTSRRPATWSLRTSFWLAVTAQVLLFAGSNFPTPLFPIYEQRYGFGSGVVTLLFGVYVVSLIPTLLLLGRVADRIGRRPLLVAGIGITVVSSVAFAAARNLAWLFAGEIIYGIGSGLVMSCVAVAIRELHPRQHVAGGALVASVAAAAGLTARPARERLPGVDHSVADRVALRPRHRRRHPSGRRPPAYPGDPTRRGPPSRRRAAADRPRPPRHPDRRSWPTRSPAAPASASSAGSSGCHRRTCTSSCTSTSPSQSWRGCSPRSWWSTNGASQLVLRRHHSPAAMQLSLVGVAAGMGADGRIDGRELTARRDRRWVDRGAGAGVSQMNAIATIQRIAPDARPRRCHLGLLHRVLRRDERAGDRRLETPPTASGSAW